MLYTHIRIFDTQVPNISCIILKLCFQDNYLMSITYTCVNCIHRKRAQETMTQGHFLFVYPLTRTERVYTLGCLTEKKKCGVF